MPTSTAIRLLQPSNSLDQAIDDFAVRLRAKGSSEHTVSAYIRDLHCFIKALPGVDPSDITATMIDTALTDPSVVFSDDGRIKSAATMHRLKAVVRSFFAWCEEAGLTENNLARSVKMK